MATHGTDQDMVQRMLTAKDYHKSRLALILSGLIDVPVGLAFAFIGILIYVYYQHHPDSQLPTKNPEIFSYYILHQLPPGARGLLIAGVLATAMGSLSTALNALATSFTQDFWVPYLGNKGETDRQTVTAVRWSTVVFAVLLAAVGTITAAIVVYSPHARIIPVVLGIFGYTYGSLLGIFLLGLTTKNRGTEKGNLIGMLAGFISVAIWSGLPWDVINAVRGQSYDIGPNVIWFAQHGLLKFAEGYVHPPDWLVQIEFPWRVMFGTLTTYAVAWCFKRDTWRLLKYEKEIKAQRLDSVKVLENFLGIDFCIRLLFLGSRPTTPRSRSGGARMQAVQTTRTIGLCLYRYAQDHNGQYPDGKTSTEVFQQLIDEKYVTDPSIFYLTYMRARGKIPWLPESKRYAPKARKCLLGCDLLYRFNATRRIACGFSDRL